MQRRPGTTVQCISIIRFLGMVPGHRDLTLLENTLRFKIIIATIEIKYHLRKHRDLRSLRSLEQTL